MSVNDNALLALTKSKFDIDEWDGILIPESPQMLTLDCT